MAAGTFTIKSKDGTRLEGRSWIPEGNMDTVVCLVHGLGEHVGRYGGVGSILNSKHIGMLGIDLRGHGESDGKRGHTPSYDHLLDDVQALLDHIKSTYPNVPVILYGHSLGGNIATNFLLRRDTTGLVGGVISSPWYKLAFEPPAFKVALAKMMRNIYPAFTEPNDIDPADLSTDPEVGKAYTVDPLVHSKITAGMFFSVFEAGNWALDHANDLQIKTLVMHGSEDKLTSAEGSAAFVKNAGGIAAFQSWKGMRHEPHNEPGDSVAAFVAGWIQGISHPTDGGTTEPVTA